MATTLNTLYPPQVETFMPPFRYNSSAKIWFNVSSYNEDMIDSIKFIHISMVDQRNNVNVFAGSNSSKNTVYPQYYPLVFNGAKNNNNNSNNKMGYDPNKKMYWAVIPPQVLKTKPYYNAGQYYKIQIRFDLTNDSSNDTHKGPTKYFYRDGSSDTATADALQLASYTNENEDSFSEWSVGTLIKPILIPSLTIQNFSPSQATTVLPSTDIPVVGTLQFNKVSGDTLPRDKQAEWLSWYQIKILNTSKTVTYYDSNKIYADIKLAKNQINHKADLSTTPTNNNIMTIIYETNSGYTTSIDFPISVSNNGYSDLSTDVTCIKTIDEENGNIVLNFSGLNNLNGYLVVRRASHYTNFTHWDLLAAKDISSISSWELIDNTVESMTGYRYRLQRISGNTLYAPKYIEANDVIHCDFYGALFSDADKTLRITFNFQLSNRANAINRTKVDTLGGRYPIFTQNSKLEYHMYSISGKISTEDNGELFLSKQDIFGPEYYNYRYTYTKNDNRQDLHEPSIFTNETNRDDHNVECQKIKPSQDWLYEREYRNAVEKWLNNGKPKLFRSMTEGNMIVILDGVTMTPDIALGSRLYNFSATMYEIGDGKDLDSIASFGLFNVIDER